MMFEIPRHLKTRPAIVPDKLQWAPDAVDEAELKFGGAAPRRIWQALADKKLIAVVISETSNEHFPAPAGLWQDDDSYKILSVGCVKYHPGQYGVDWSPTAEKLSGRVFLDVDQVKALFSPGVTPEPKLDLAPGPEPMADVEPDYLSANLQDDSTLTHGQSAELAAAEVQHENQQDGPALTFGQLEIQVPTPERALPRIPGTEVILAPEHLEDDSNITEFNMGDPVVEDFKAQRVLAIERINECFKTLAKQRRNLNWWDEMQIIKKTEDWHAKKFLVAAVAHRVDAKSGTVEKVLNTIDPKWHE